MNQTLLAEVQRQFETGLAMHRAGRLGLAESHYARVVKLDPKQADAWHLLGVVAYQSGNAAKAIKHHRRALELRPDFASAWNNLGIALKARGDFGAAADAFQRALAASPEYAEAMFNLGLLHQDQGDLAQAEQRYRDALQRQPASVHALTNLGNLLARTRRGNEAIALLARAHELAPSPDSAGNLALALLDVGRYSEARGMAQAALSGGAEAATWWAAFGTAARLQGDSEAALPALERAATLEPNNAMGWFELGLARAGTGADESARAALARARSLAPAATTVRWAEALLAPAWVPDEAAVDAACARFGAGLAGIESTLQEDIRRDPAGVMDAVAGASPFNLHYLARDTTALQFRFGDLIHAAATGAMPRFATAPPQRGRAPGDRLRVGFVSAFLSQHTVSRYFAPFWRGLDPSRFERWLWYTGEVVDAELEASSAAVDHFEQTRAGIARLGDQIRACELDVLVYPDIGMDPRQQALAALRLAPLQAALYGHPVTTGLPTVDAYFSGDALEREDAARHYRERLVRLPGLGAAPSAPAVGPERAWFDALRDGRPLLLCLQNLAKLTPSFDPVLARVLAESGARLCLFDRGRSFTERVLARLAPALKQHGVDPEQALCVLPVRPYPEFLGAIAGVDLVLDTPWFSGGATSLDTIAMGSPIVAWEGEFARGRQTSAMLRLVGLPELVASDADGYVERALRVLRDRPFADACRGRLRANGARLFADGSAVVAAFSVALEDLARAPSSSS